MNAKPVVLISGASSGLGRAAAEFLGNNGYRVYGTSRRPQSDPPKNYTILELDVTSDHSVTSCLDKVKGETGRIDVLVNNAGYALFGSVEETSIDEAVAQVDTNFFGSARVTRAVLPIMRRQGGGKVINVGSLSGLIGTPFGAYYCASKFALEGFTEALRHEVKPFKIFVSILEPGYFKTGITDHQKQAVTSIDEYTEREKRWVKADAEGVKQGGEPELVARTILRIIESSSPKTRYKIGPGKWGARIRPFVPESIFEAGLVRSMGR